MKFLYLVYSIANLSEKEAEYLKKVIEYLKLPATLEEILAFTSIFYHFLSGF